MGYSVHINCNRLTRTKQPVWLFIVQVAFLGLPQKVFMLCKEFTCILFFFFFAEGNTSANLPFLWLSLGLRGCVSVWVCVCVCIAALWPGNSLCRNDLVARDDCAAFGLLPLFFFLCASYFFSHSFQFLFFFVNCF